MIIFFILLTIYLILSRRHYGLLCSFEIDSQTGSCHMYAELHCPSQQDVCFLWRSSFREEKIITPFDDSGRPGICKTLKVGKKTIYHLGKIRVRIIHRLYHRCSLVYCSRHESPVLAFELQRKNFSPSLLKSAG